MPGIDPLRGFPQEAAALQDLVILLGEALAVYAELCSRRRALDFIALEQAALKLLAVEDPGELLLRLDQRLTHLLVDEFQDTSQNQMDLLCRLLAGWQKGEGRTLMVVGDPKQSIYGWRQAKPRLFLESRTGLPCPEAAAVPLTPLLLTTNFRASRTLIAWANQVFGDTVMGRTAGGEIDFHAGGPRPRGGGGPAPHLALFAGGDDPSGPAARGPLAGPAGGRGRAHPAENETIGILLFTRTHLPVYLQALNDAGVAVRVREGLKLADSRVAAHLHNLARALTRPQDEAGLGRGAPGPLGPPTPGGPGRGGPDPGGVCGWRNCADSAGQRRRSPGLANLAAALWGPGPGGAAAPGGDPGRLSRGHRRLGRARRLGRPRGSGQRPGLPGPPGRGGIRAAGSHLQQGRLQPGGGLSAPGPPGPGLPGGGPDGARRQGPGVSPGSFCPSWTGSR